MNLDEDICYELTVSHEWVNSLSCCEPGIYGINYWEVYINNEDINIHEDKFIFRNAYFYFEVQMHSSNIHECLINTFTKKAYGEGKYKCSNNKIKIYAIIIDYDKSLFPSDSHPLLGGYFLDELRKLYQKKIIIPKSDHENFKIYIENVSQPYDNLEYIKKYLHNNARKLEVGNNGTIKFNDNELIPSLVKNGPHKGFCKGIWDEYLEINIPGIFIRERVLLVHRLVAEVWCENPNSDIYTRVHHISDDSKNNSQNLLFVTEEQHNCIHK
jgi:hypothetical protein